MWVLSQSLPQVSDTVTLQWVCFYLPWNRVPHLEDRKWGRTAREAPLLQLDCTVHSVFAVAKPTNKGEGPDMAIRIFEIRCYLEIRPYIQSFRIGLISVESLSPFLFRFNFDGGRNVFSDFDLNSVVILEHESRPWKAFKNRWFLRWHSNKIILLKLWNMNLYYYRHYWSTISIFMFQNTCKSAVHMLFSSSSGFKSNWH